MPAERFPVEASHILMFARAIGDPNPIYADPNCTAAAEFGGVIAPPRSSRRARSSTRPTACVPNRASRGSAPVVSRPACLPRVKRGRAAGCMRSSTSSTTDHCSPARCSDRHLKLVAPGIRTVAAAGCCGSPKRSPNTEHSTENSSSQRPVSVFAPAKSSRAGKASHGTDRRHVVRR